MYDDSTVGESYKLWKEGGIGDWNWKYTDKDISLRSNAILNKNKSVDLDKHVSIDYFKHGSK